MQRYLEAADIAMDAAIVHGDAPQAGTQRVLAKDSGGIAEGIKKNRYLELPDQQAFVKFFQGDNATIDNLPVKTAGRYRFQIECWPHQPDGRSLAMSVYVINRDYWATGGRGGEGLIGYFDVTGAAAEPTVVRFETTIGPREVLRVEPYKLGSLRSLNSKTMSEVTSMGLAVRGVEVEGPLEALEGWPPASHQRLFGDLPLARRSRSGPLVLYSDSPKQDAERLLREFLPRAWRRPVSDAAAQPFIALAHNHLDEDYDFEQAMRVAYRAILCSPQFLVINQAPAKRDDHAIASRLSYFLWSTLPDEALLKLAAAGKLRDPAVLREQVDRLLRDPRAGALTENFLGQWLDLRLIEETTPDAKLYPEFDKLLQLSMVGETQRFFEELLKYDLSVLNFVASDFSMLNERMAKQYGIEGIKGYEQFRRVELSPGTHRGGVLTHASLLKVTADGTRTSPVLRGAWVLENLFPTTAGRDFEETPYLAQLKDFRNDYTICSGVSHPRVGGGHKSLVSFLTGAPDTASPSFKNSVSLDQFAAAHIGHLTRYPSLTLKNKAEEGKLSWTNNGVVVPADHSCAKVFARLFLDGRPDEVRLQVRRLREGKSVMDTVADQASAMQRTLGKQDQQTLDQYFTAVRELEQRLVAAEQWSHRPKPKVDVPPMKDLADESDFVGEFNLMYDLSHLALRTDSTRLITIALDGYSRITPAVAGVSEPWHNLSHHGNDPAKIEQLKALDLANFAALAGLLKKLHDDREGEGTLLDKTMVLFGSNLGNGSSHSTVNLPILLAGGGFRHGRHLAFDQNNNYPLSNLFVSMLQRIGIEADSFASSTGTLAGLSMV